MERTKQPERPNYDARIKNLRRKIRLGIFGLGTL